MGLNNHSHWRASKPIIIITTTSTTATITTTDWLLGYLKTLILEKVIMTYFKVSYYPSILPGETEESNRKTDNSAKI
jgi:hypothetical protein